MTDTSMRARIAAAIAAESAGILCAYYDDRTRRYTIARVDRHLYVWRGERVYEAVAMYADGEPTYASTTLRDPGDPQRPPQRQIPYTDMPTACQAAAAVMAPGPCNPIPIYI